MAIRGEFEQARDFLILHRADYDYAFNQFKWPQLENFNWALDYFDSMAEGNNNTALWIINEDGKEEKYSFADLSARSGQVANYLRKLGVHKGDSILLMVGNDTAYWEIMLAAMKLGAVVVPASPYLSEAELEDRLLRGRVRLVVTTKDHADRFRFDSSSLIPLLVDGSMSGWHDYADATRESASYEASEKTKATDAVLMYFTSSMAAKPKMVEHSYLSFTVGHLSSMFWMGLRPGDIHLGISSPGWSMHDWNSFIAPWNAEATIFVDHLSRLHGRFDAKILLDTMEHYRITTFCAPPSVWRKLLQEDLTQFQIPLREALSTGEPLTEDIVEKVHQAWGLQIRDGFSQTETSMLIGVAPGQRAVPGSLGKPLPGYSIRLLDEAGKEVKEGEICVEAAVLKTHPYHSGDVARIDKAGNYSYVGRNDALFKCSDYRISPFEIESVLLENPAVREVAVIPSPDPIRYAVPKAIVVLAKGFEPTKEIAIDIMNYTRSRLAPFKRVRRVEFHDLLKGSDGTILRMELIKKEQEKRQTNDKSLYEFWEEDARATLPETWAQDLP
ncbi:AMP-binding protein [Bdellovibrio svalbardensis]|uniref:AMP-binding protein n=1 Tax=Bdellovibrio svalbardensis TaxID=2972972 RepID=A0ABT6DKH5_9BACT|nr:AMP-binding protein [Bdellovibrio svalbardensis]MDG0817044.1 AMP-binding protein [Bdellovibrio svalbardensis]